MPLTLLVMYMNHVGTLFGVGKTTKHNRRRAAETAEKKNSKRSRDRTVTNTTQLYTDHTGISL